MIVVGVCHLQTMATGWEDEDDFEQQEERTEASGKEYYTFIVHYKKLKKVHFVPHVYQYDKRGQRLTSNYSRATGDDRKASYRTESVGPALAATKRIAAWKTSADVLNDLPQGIKTICNSIKAYFNKSQVGVWFHDATVDKCSQFGGPHLHVITRSEMMSTDKDGKPRYRPLGNIKMIKTLKKKIREEGGYFKQQGVRNLSGLINHLNEAPRIYMGTNCGDIFKARQVATPHDGDVDDCLSEADVSDSEDQGREWTGFEDECNQASAREINEWDDDVEEPPKKKQKVEYSYTDSMVRFCRILQSYYNVFTPSDIWKKVNKDKDLQNEDAKRMRKLWYRISTRSAVTSWMKIAKEQQESEWVHKSFGECVDWYCRHIPNPVDEYETPELSYDIFLEWLQDQGYDKLETVRNIIDCLDKKENKKNTLCFIGRAQSGKTTMIVNPLREVVRFCGQPGNRAANGSFVYSDFPNKRMLTMDECVFAREHMEDMKLILGGELFKTDVKYGGLTNVERTPVLMTGNKDPWTLHFESKEPLLTRIHYYATRPIPELEHIKKKLSPKMWWYLLQLYSSTTVPPVEDLVSVPEEVESDAEPEN